MEPYVLDLMSESGRIILKFENNELGYSCYGALLSVFWEIENNTVTLNEVQCVDSELVERVDNFVDTWKENYGYLNRIKFLFKKLKCGEYFLIFPQEKVTTQDISHYEQYLICLNKTENEADAKELFELSKAETDEYIGDLFKAYNLFTHSDTKRMFIGESDKAKRRCRFCTKSINDGASFSQIAHAIPEALGNKSVILFDECDTCNSYFGDDIEPSLIEFLDFYRVSLGVKGKKGVPKIKYNNGQVSRAEDITFVMSEDINGEPNDVLQTSLKSSRKFSAVNFYKSLCKMALSVVDDHWIDKSSESIKWLRYGNDELELPKIASCINHHGFSKTAQVIIYTRINDNKKLPLIVGEFRLGSYVYVFIVPFTADTDCSFINADEYEYFWNFFKLYSLNDGWSFNNYSSVIEKKLNYNIRMVHSPNTEGK